MSAFTVTTALLLWLSASCWAHNGRHDGPRCSCTLQPHISLESQKRHTICVCERTHAVPGNLTGPVWALSVTMSDMQVLSADDLRPYQDTLRDLTLSRMSQLTTIEPGTFHSIRHLRTIDISRAPQLKRIDASVFDCTLNHLRTLRIIHSGLEAVPNLNQLKTDYTLHTIDFESNNIMRIEKNAFHVAAEELLLSWNMINVIEDEAFAGSQIAKLVLRGNRMLTELGPKAFFNVHSLRKLDLSRTSITYLPTAGLNELEVLQLEDTESLKTFPSIYKFKAIEEAILTYPYHCCAFQFPATHSPEDYARHQEFERECERQASSTPESPRIQWSMSNVDDGADQWGAPRIDGRTRRAAVHASGNFSAVYMHGRATWGDIAHRNASPSESAAFDPEETFHQGGVTVTSIHITCGNLSKNYQTVKCAPVPDAFNPCEDLMGNWALRVAVWAVAIAALVGNFAVLLVLVSSTFRMTVPKFLMCNLAVADLCMGLYLLLIAITDARSVGEYFNYAIDWQSDLGCQVAGFLTVLASELSIFTLAVITSERWYTITYAIHLNKRLKLRTAARIMAAGWVYSLFMAILPVFGVSSYSKTSICLPLESREMKDVAYLVTLLIFNGLAFSLICVCYARMYGSIKGGQDAVQARSDMTVAKRMALLVFTDFACWAPITFFGLTALAGYPLIDVPKTKILLVFFYPLNSCANPYLYALLTQQYRRDLFILLSRYGLCSARAARYKGATGSKQPRGNTEEVNCNASGKGQEGPHRGSLLTSLTFVDNVQVKPALGPVHEFSLELLPTQATYSPPEKSHSVL